MAGQFWSRWGSQIMVFMSQWNRTAPIMNQYHTSHAMIIAFPITIRSVSDENGVKQYLNQAVYFWSLPVSFAHSTVVHCSG